MKKYIKQFQKKLLAEGFTFKEIEPDGNCLFRAIADQLTNNEENYSYYRKLTIRQIKKNSKFFRDFLPSDCTLEEYLNLMSEDGVWGGHLELQAICDCLQLDIFVHSLSGNYIIRHRPYKGCWDSFVRYLVGSLGQKRRQQIHLGFMHGKNVTSHYVSLKQEHSSIVSSTNVSDNSCIF